MSAAESKWRERIKVLTPSDSKIKQNVCVLCNFRRFGPSLLWAERTRDPFSNFFTSSVHHTAGWCICK